jgi:hypothetical protein
MRHKKNILRICSFGSIFFMLFFLIPEHGTNAQTPSFQTDDEIRSERAAQRLSQKSELVGNTLWFVPNKSAVYRIGFYKSLQSLSDKLYPTSLITIKITKKVSGALQSDHGEYYYVTFADGSTGYIDSMMLEGKISGYTTNSITDENIEDARNDLFDTYKSGYLFPEMFFKENPSKLKEKIAILDRINGRRSERGISVGMKQEQVLSSSWGKPSAINKTITSGIVSEQWVYSGYNYLYFRDGVLTVIQKAE